MCIQEKIKLLNVIENWCFQLYDKRCCNITEDEYGIRIFELLPKYENNFPADCFYSGMVYRKANKGYNCPTQLVACSSVKGANANVGLLSINQPRYYQSTCDEGYDLYKIVKWLLNELKIEDRFVYGYSLLQRIRDESEIICYMNKRNFRKESKQ